MDLFTDRTVVSHFELIYLLFRSEFRECPLSPIGPSVFPFYSDTVGRLLVEEGNFIE